MTENRVGDLLLQDKKILFRNFAGREREYNSEGDRNFSVLLEPELARKLSEEGWNVKALKVREEGEEPDYHLPVTVNYKKGRPPRCVMITSRGRTDLGADEVGILDAADINKVDMILHPYRWDVNGNSGIKAYLKSIFVTINEDELELLYSGLPDANDYSQSGDDE